MTLHAPTHRREKILAYGQFNSGKSSMTLSLAQWRADTGADWHIHLADTEGAWEAMDNGLYGDFVHVTPLDVEDYAPWITWVRDTKKNAGPDDWVIVDVHRAWDASEVHYFGPLNILAQIHEANQKSIETAGKEGKPMGGAYGSKWGVRRRWYEAFHLPLTSMPCHTIAMAHADELREYHNQDVRDTYKVGWKPEGPDDLPNLFHTVLFCAQAGGEWVYTTVREKGPVGRTRKLLKGAVVDREGGFVQGYLLGVAGWRP